MATGITLEALAFAAAVSRRMSRLRGPDPKQAEASETGKPSRDRSKVKAARKQNRKRKKGGA